MNLTPTPGRIIVKMDLEDEKTAGGLFLPGNAIKEGNFGTVVACCPHAYYDDTDRLTTPIARKGDRVAIGRYAGVRIDHEGEEYVVLKQDEVLAIAEPVLAVVG